MSEAVALRPPEELGAVADHLPGGRKRGEVVELDVGRAGLLQELGRAAGGRVHAVEPVAPEVAAAVGVEHVAAVGGPLHVGEGGVAAREVAGLGRDVGADRGAGLDVEDPELGGGDDGVARERVGPRVQDRASVGGFEQVEASHLALVVAVGGDAARVGRPLEDGRAFTVGAAARDLLAAALGDRAVAEVGLAVVGELGLLAAGGVPHPQVLVAGEGDPATVGRGAFGGGGRGGAGRSVAGVGADVAGPLHRVGHLEAHGGAPVHEVEFLEGEGAALVGGVGGDGEGRREARVVEGGAAGGGGRVDDDELVAGSGAAAEPEAVAVEELGHDLVAGDEVGRVPGQELLGAGVGALRDLLGGEGGGGERGRRDGGKGGGGGENQQRGGGSGVQGTKLRRHGNLSGWMTNGVAGILAGRGAVCQTRPSFGSTAQPQRSSF